MTNLMHLFQTMEYHKVIPIYDKKAYGRVEV